MREDDTQQSGEILELDFTPRFLEKQEWDDVRNIVMQQVSPDYDLAVNYGEQPPVTMIVPVEDISPGWEALRAHYTELLGTLTHCDDPPLPPSSGDWSDLRLYPVRHKDQSLDEPPTTVVIAWQNGEGTVISFNSAEPEMEESSDQFDVPDRA